MEILKFIFQSFWHFIGFAILLSITGSVILKSIAIINIRKIGEYESKIDSEKQKSCNPPKKSKWQARLDELAEKRKSDLIN